MLKWLSDHVFLASWLSVLISLIAMLMQARRASQPYKWNQIMLRLGFLICLSAILTPSVDLVTRHVFEAMAAALLGVLVVRSGQE